jgi:NAD(P)-dependent dehydrogenase (short-subunit alcohol dehydrogenase family)
MRLRDKVVLITGGTTGIGAATARLFQSEGAKVVVTGSSAKTVEAAKPTLPGVEVVVADQADTQASKSLVDHVKDRYGAIDVLFVNAGVGKFATLDRADEAHFDSIFNIDVRGLYFMAKHAAPIIPCMDAPARARCFANGGSRDRVRSCIRPQIRQLGAAGRYGDARTGRRSNGRACELEGFYCISWSGSDRSFALTVRRPPHTPDVPLAA